MSAVAARGAGSPLPGHFSAFSFVDRISDFAPGTRAAGRFAIPDGLASFPACLVAEAVGQLAAWVAMAHVEFRVRPVAGLAEETRFLGAATPGQRLDLEVEIERCDDEAVAYSGCARVGGAPVLELRHCLGPMLPLADFDAPEAVRARFEALRNGGVAGGTFPGVGAPEMRVIERQPGERVRAELQVPAAAPFFADHFPRRPVFPGTLLLDAQIRLGTTLANELPHPQARRFAPARVCDVKIRSFTPPGQTLELEARLAPRDGGVGASLSARANGKQIASARLELALQPQEDA